MHVTVSGKDGFSIRSTDGDYRLRIRGYIQADARHFVEDDANKGVSSFLLRRVRPIIEGTVAKHIKFRIMPDFAGSQLSLQDAYIELDYFKAAVLRAGKFKAPFGLERLQSATALIFPERAFPTGLAPNRDIGIQLGGDIAKGALNYAVGIFNGVTDGGSADIDTNEDKEFTGRVFLYPFRLVEIEALNDVGVGFAGSYGDQKGSNTAPGLSMQRSPGQLTIFRYLAGNTPPEPVVANGTRYRLSPQGYAYVGPVGVFGEYVYSSQEVVTDFGNPATQQRTFGHHAWQAAASVVLTGERASYQGVNPSNPYGAVELTGRVHQLRIDKDVFPAFANPVASISKATAWGAGLNWYINRHLRYSTSYEQTFFKGGEAGVAPVPFSNRENEKVWFNRVQVSF
ncbi:MAG: porin [Deltaproteobacteria bacterium]|nr:porin [Deltaproteobacteria bacterium]